MEATLKDVDLAHVRAHILEVPHVHAVHDLHASALAAPVALLGFGLDSAIEGWEQKAVAVTFFLLAPYIAYDAAATLIAGSHAETSWPGIGLSVASLIVMPALGVAKRRLGSAATAGEGSQNLLCAYLAAAVLAGLLANTAS